MVSAGRRSDAEPLVDEAVSTLVVVAESIVMTSFERAKFPFELPRYDIATLADGR